MKSHEDRIFTRENFDNKSFSNDIFSDCKFKNCSFQKNDFRDTQLSDCIFKNSKLHLIKLGGCRFQNVIFEDGNYRITHLNQAVKLIGLFQKALESKKKPNILSITGKRSVKCPG